MFSSQITLGVLPLLLLMHTSMSWVTKHILPEEKQSAPFAARTVPTSAFLDEDVDAIVSDFQRELNNAHRFSEGKKDSADREYLDASLKGPLTKIGLLRMKQLTPFTLRSLQWDTDFLVKYRRFDDSRYLWASIDHVKAVVFRNPGRIETGVDIEVITRSSKHIQNGLQVICYPKEYEVLQNPPKIFGDTPSKCIFKNLPKDESFLCYSRAYDQNNKSEETPFTADRSKTLYIGIPSQRK